jgi:hypothetical protein
VYPKKVRVLRILPERAYIRQSLIALAPIGQYDNNSVIDIFNDGHSIPILACRVDCVCNNCEPQHRDSVDDEKREGKIVLWQWTY